MTKLLVSVRSAAEAEAAIGGGANLIDVKEPQHGSLGRASAKALREIAGVVVGRAPLSAALGELGEPLDDSLFEALDGYSFAKVGLAGAAANPQWREDWADVVARLPAHVSPVAVVYADGRHCASPPTEAIIAQAGELCCCAWLLDTFHKDGCNLFSHWPLRKVRDFIVTARAANVMSVVAGSLNDHAVQTAATLRPDCIAVRSAACGGGRTSPVRRALVAEIAHRIRLASAPVGTTN